MKLICQSYSDFVVGEKSLAFMLNEVANKARKDVSISTKIPKGRIITVIKQVVQTDSGYTAISNNYLVSEGD